MTNITTLPPLQTNNTIHNVTGFVDDNTSVIAHKDTQQLQKYLTYYFTLLQHFHNINKLKINSDKTQLMISTKNKNYNKITNFTFKANNDTITNKPSIKILGMTLTHDLNMDTQIGNLCANLHHRLHNIRQLTHVTTFTTRL